MNKVVAGIVFCILGGYYYGSHMCFATRDSETAALSHSKSTPSNPSSISSTTSIPAEENISNNPPNSSDANETSASTKSSSESIRRMCKEAQQLEHDITSAEATISTFNKKEKNTAPILKSTYELLTRCFTLLFDIQRFSKFLAMSPRKNGADKNDFVRCSIIIKNFSRYFEAVSAELSKNTNEIIAIKKKREEKTKELAEKKAKHVKLRKLIKQAVPEHPKGGEESMIENVVYHIATKSNSLEELDAELESENAVGVLKNTKVNSELSLVNPVAGKLVNEFGDKGKNGSMICSLGFETRKGAIVTSPAKGLVVFSGKFLNYGHMVIISNGDYRVFIYGLSDDTYATTGDVVEIGDYIGTMSDEARSTNNPIIEMELRKFGEPLDPRHWLVQTMNKENENSDSNRNHNNGSSNNKKTETKA